jgi:hypothetical protein
MRGIASTIVIFVLAALIFVVAVWFLLSKVFPNILYQLEKLLGIVKPTPIESAIMCSIARCKYGCNSFRVRDISWVDYDDSGRKINVNCWEKFCSGTSPDVYSEGDKICERMPVSINLKSSQRISTDHFYDVTEGEEIKIQSTKFGLGFGWGLWSSLLQQILDYLKKTEYVIGVIDENIVAYGDAVDCAVFTIPFTGGAQITLTGCYKSVEVKEGKYTITTFNFRKLILTGPSIYATAIDKSA